MDVGEDDHLSEVRLLDQELIVNFPRGRMPMKISPPGLTSERKNAQQYIESDMIQLKIRFFIHFVVYFVLRIVNCLVFNNLIQIHYYTFEKGGGYNDHHRKNQPKV